MKNKQAVNAIKDEITRLVAISKKQFEQDMFWSQSITNGKIEGLKKALSILKEQPKKLTLSEKWKAIKENYIKS